MKIKEIAISEINAASYNPRRDWTEKEKIAFDKGMEKYGCVTLIVWNEATGNLVGGHKRLAWMVEQGVKKVEVSVVNLSLKDEKRLNLALNRQGQGLWDDKKLGALFEEFEFEELEMTGFDAVELEEFGFGNQEPEAPEPQIDRAAELQKKWKVKRGQVWEVQSETVKGKAHRIMCGDSTKVTERFRGVVELILTDPPYGIGIVKPDGKVIGEKRFKRPKGTVGATAKNTIKGRVGVSNIVRAHIYTSIEGDADPFDPRWLLGIGKGQIIFGGNYFASKLPDRACWIVWYKRREEWGSCSYAEAELAWTSFDRPMKVYQHIWMGLVREREAVDQITEGRVHPTQKPVKLIRRIIEDFTEEGEIIGDPYLGVGTTTVAAEQTGRICYGMEICEKYIAVTLQRLKDMGLRPKLQTKPRRASK